MPLPPGKRPSSMLDVETHEGHQQGSHEEAIYEGVRMEREEVVSKLRPSDYE